MFTLEIVKGGNLNGVIMCLSHFHENDCNENCLGIFKVYTHKRAYSASFSNVKTWRIPKDALKTFV